MRKFYRSLICAIPISVGLLLAGCATGTGTAGSAGPAPTEAAASSDVDWGPFAPMSDAQAGALSDSTVTEEEYRAGFQRFSACLNSAGVKLADVKDSGVVISYAYPTAAEEVASECYQSEFGQLDSSWQLANEDQSATTQLLQDCLREQGIEPAQTAAEVSKQLAEANIDIASCV